MSSDHAHSHAGHSHGVSAAADARKLGVALGLILGFMTLDIVAGVNAHSLALLCDAGHMLTDAAAIGLSLVAARLAVRPTRGALTYGVKRVVGARRESLYVHVRRRPEDSLSTCRGPLVRSRARMIAW